MFKGIQQIATNNDIQSLITTHSWECICAAYNVFAEAGRLEDFQLIRLEQDGENVQAVIIKDKNLETVMEAGYEIR
jgi:AAA15 family ATPase/GTPase